MIENIVVRRATGEREREIQHWGKMRHPRHAWKDNISQYKTSRLPEQKEDPQWWCETRGSFVLQWHKSYTKIANVINIKYWSPSTEDNPFITYINQCVLRIIRWLDLDHAYKAPNLTHKPLCHGLNIDYKWKENIPHTSKNAHTITTGQSHLTKPFAESYYIINEGSTNNIWHHLFLLHLWQGVSYIGPVAKCCVFLSIHKKGSFTLNLLLLVCCRESTLLFSNPISSQTYNCRYTVTKEPHVKQKIEHGQPERTLGLANHDIDLNVANLLIKSARSHGRHRCPWDSAVVAEEDCTSPLLSITPNEIDW